MKNKDKISIYLSILGTIASLSSLGFISFVELFNSNKSLIEGVFKPIVLGLAGSIIGAIVSVYILRINAKSKAPSVFISYHYSNKNIARKVANELKGISDHVWFDAQEINIGDNIKNKVESGLNNSDLFVIILSNEANKSHWAEAELSKAMELGKVIFPVKTDNSETPEMIKDVAYADLSKSFDSGIGKLKRAFLAEAHNKKIQRTV